ncbi:hypothetical protein FDP41_009917 [Naegleria fowleri]|uniref:SAM domain-containing protein n=1 Tax=Naegleria fowleri TaxID=5763 RepID=A0A6A5BC56_NAEFO|nr:uncharacterized protein FDP41_009917 [Naegleria fowleri]KAF0971694.1 hypothetical protein FDP41_009917 [Naegleria fowleri]
MSSHTRRSPTSPYSTIHHNNGMNKKSPLTLLENHSSSSYLGKKKMMTIENTNIRPIHSNTTTTRNSNTTMTTPIHPSPLLCSTTHKKKNSGNNKPSSSSSSSFTSSNRAISEILFSSPTRGGNHSSLSSSSCSSSSVSSGTTTTPTHPTKNKLYYIGTKADPSLSFSSSTGSKASSPPPLKSSSSLSVITPSNIQNHKSSFIKEEELRNEEEEEESYSFSSSSSSSRILETIKTYNRIDSLIEMQDEGLKILRSYLRQRQNEEYLLYLEVTREYKKKRELRKNEDSDLLLLLEEFEKVYQEFLNFESVTCMNIPAGLREQFVNVWIEKGTRCKDLEMQRPTTSSNTTSIKATNHTGTEETENNDEESENLGACSPSSLLSNTLSITTRPRTISPELAQKMRKCLDDLFISVQIQFKNEIMPHFKKTEEFKTFLLTKLIELSSQPQQASESQTCFSLSPGKVLIQDFLTQNGELSEYCKAFSKKNLITMEQIRNFTSDDFRDKIGIKKIGHLKRMVRLTREHFMHE